jgi:hypothetical protein
MIARLLISIGVVAAAVGFTFFGIATSTYEMHDDAALASYILMAGGGIATVLGYVIYRASLERRG